jgi:hypothetical protein
VAALVTHTRVRCGTIDEFVKALEGHWAVQSPDIPHPMARAAKSKFPSGEGEARTSGKFV